MTKKRLILPNNNIQKDNLKEEKTFNISDKFIQDIMIKYNFLYC